MQVEFFLTSLFYYIIATKAGFYGHLGEAALMQNRAEQGKGYLLQCMGYHQQMELMEQPQDVSPNFVLPPEELLLQRMLEIGADKASIGMGRGDIRGKLRSMSYLAGAYCMLGQNERGGGLFARVLQLESLHIGENHANLAEKYVNAGICLREGYQRGSAQIAQKKDRKKKYYWTNWWELGCSYLEKAREILKQNPLLPGIDHLLGAIERELKARE